MSVLVAPMPRRRKSAGAELVARLVDWRKRARVQAGEVAERLGLNGPTLSNYEREERGFPPELVDDYARAVFDLARQVEADTRSVRAEIADWQRDHQG